MNESRNKVSETLKKPMRWLVSPAFALFFGPLEMQHNIYTELRFANHGTQPRNPFTKKVVADLSFFLLSF